jgi:hypothetical protein
MHQHSSYPITARVKPFARRHIAATRLVSLTGGLLMQFALNHMVAPKLGYTAFFDLAVSLGVKAVEIRNDITPSLMDMASARNIRAMATERGLSILTVNAL